MEGHAAFPDAKDAGRICQPGVEIVEEDVSQPPAEDHADGAVEEQVVHLLRAPSWLIVTNAPARQRPAAGHSHQVHEAVPMDLEGPKLQGHGIDVGVDHDFRMPAARAGKGSSNRPSREWPDAPGDPAPAAPVPPAAACGRDGGPPSAAFPATAPPPCDRNRRSWPAGRRGSAVPWPLRWCAGRPGCPPLDPCAAWWRPAGPRAPRRSAPLPVSARAPLAPAQRRTGPRRAPPSPRPPRQTLPRPRRNWTGPAPAFPRPRAAAAGGWPPGRRTSRSSALRRAKWRNGMPPPPAPPPREPSRKPPPHSAPAPPARAPARRCAAGCPPDAPPCSAPPRCRRAAPPCPRWRSARPDSRRNGPPPGREPRRTRRTAAGSRAWCSAARAVPAPPWCDAPTATGREGDPAGGSPPARRSGWQDSRRPRPATSRRGSSPPPARRPERTSGANAACPPRCCRSRGGRHAGGARAPLPGRVRGFPWGAIVPDYSTLFRAVNHGRTTIVITGRHPTRRTTQWPTDSPTPPAPTSSSTPTTRWSGGPGARKRWIRPGGRTNPFCSPSATRPATGATWWPMNPSRTRRPPRWWTRCSSAARHGERSEGG